MDYKHVRYARKSNHLGQCLYLNLFQEKTCTFDCVYCGAGPTINKTIERKEYSRFEDILNEIKHYIEHNGQPDYIWYQCDGEPGLYSKLGILTATLKQKYPGIKIASWTNSVSFLEKRR